MLFAIIGVPGALKSVDDVLNQGRSYKDLKKKIIILFKRFEKFNIKIKVKPPSTKTEVPALLGMACQYEAWTPNLSFLSKNLRAQTHRSI